MYKLFPDAIHQNSQGHYPIHYAIAGVKYRDNPATAVDIVQFLLDCDPNQKLIQVQGKSLLQFACGLQHDVSNIEAGIQMIKVLYDSHPDSVRSVNNEGYQILHFLCDNRNLHGAAAIQEMQIL